MIFFRLLKNLISPMLIRIVLLKKPILVLLVIKTEVVVNRPMERTYLIVIMKEIQIQKTNQTRVIKRKDGRRNMV